MNYYFYPDDLYSQDLIDLLSVLDAVAAKVWIVLEHKHRDGFRSYGPDERICGEPDFLSRVLFQSREDLKRDANVTEEQLTAAMKRLAQVGYVQEQPLPNMDNAYIFNYPSDERIAAYRQDSERKEIERQQNRQRSAAAKAAAETAAQIDRGQHPELYCHGIRKDGKGCTSKQIKFGYCPSHRSQKSF